MLAKVHQRLQKNIEEGPRNKRDKVLLKMIQAVQEHPERRRRGEVSAQTGDSQTCEGARLSRLAVGRPESMPERYSIGRPEGTVSDMLAATDILVWVPVDIHDTDRVPMDINGYLWVT